MPKAKTKTKPKNNKKKRSPLLGRARLSSDVVKQRVAEAKWYQKENGMSVQGAVAKAGISQSAWHRWKNEVTALQPGMTNPNVNKTPETKEEFLELELERATQKLDDQRRINLDLIRIVTQQIGSGA